MASQESQHRNIEEIFKDFIGRRAGVIHALTRDVEEFFTLCDPAEGSLCLFAHPNESWEVVPAKIVELGFPTPVTDMNLTRDKIDRNKWLSNAALLSDSWLISVAFYRASLIKLNSTERLHLFSFINDLPTVLEVLTGKIPIEGSGNKYEDRTKRPGDGEVESNPKSEAEDQKENNEDKDEDQKNEDENNEDGNEEKNENEDEIENDEEEKNENEDEDEKDEDEDENNEDKEDHKKRQICAVCGRSVNENQDLVECKTCEGWFHGCCAMVTFGEVCRVGEYKCLTCSFYFKL